MSEHCRLLELLDDLLLFNLGLEHELFPLLIELGFPDLSGFFLHPVLLLLGLFLELQFLHLLVILSHDLTLIPLLESLGVILPLVPH